ncbi:MAG: hypothetical protein JKY37_28520, partial [Nannocystaceae bacterium]|nr:hypothetical protein [Nannocystaceae bacterium]
PADDPPADDPQQAEADGDYQSNPAVLAQFRHTSPAPTSVDTPLFNEEAIDTKGLQYLGEVSNPGDQEDWIQFSIVPGDNDPVIGLFLDCDTPDLTPQSVRAHLLDANGDVLATVSCGDDETMVTLHNASSLDDYFVRIEVMDGSEHFDAYTMEINAHCFGGCNYQPHEG